MALIFMGAANQFPFTEPGLRNAERDAIHERLRRADHYLHPNSRTDPADRIDGEAVVRFAFPQDIRDLLHENRRLQETIQRMQTAQAAVPLPQEKPAVRKPMGNQVPTFDPQRRRPARPR